MMIEHPLPDLACYQTPLPLHRLAGLVCTGYGSVAGRNERSERPAVASHAVMHIFAGSARVETAAAGRIALQAGALIWLLPGVAYTLTPGPAGWSEQWALFEGPMAQSFELMGLLSRTRPVVQPRDPAGIAALFAQLRADFTAEGPLAGLLGAAVIHRLVVVAHGLEGAVAPDPPSRTQGAQRAVALIDAWALQPLDLRAVAEACGIGDSTLRRRFKQETGQSITAYVLQRRLSRARELLALTSMSVAEVAHAVGFVDPYYFSRLFHLKEGLSPTAFRTLQRTDR